METIDPTALPPQEAIEAFRRKGYELSFDYRDVDRAQHARAFTVAKVASLDILQDIRDAVDAALADGQTFREFQSRLRPILQEKGWWGRQEMVDPKTGEVREVQLGSPRRLGIIYDTNLRTAFAAGEWERIQRTKERAPFLRYSAVMDERTREKHRQYHGLVRPADDPIWDEIFPPNGFRCRCAVDQMSQRDLERYGHSVSEPFTPMRRVHRNGRTGEVLEVAEGVHPAFAYNPGRAALPVADPARYSADALGHEAARASVRSPDFERLLSGDLRGAMPVGHLDSTLASQIGAGVRRVDLSSETVAKQRQAHPDLTLAEYQLLPEVIRRGLVMRQGDVRLAFFQDAGRWYKAVVKATGDGRALYATSYHRLHGDAAKEIARERRRSDWVRDAVDE